MKSDGRMKQSVMILLSTKTKDSNASYLLASFQSFLTTAGRKVPTRRLGRSKCVWRAANAAPTTQEQRSGSDMIINSHRRDTRHGTSDFGYTQTLVFFVFCSAAPLHTSLSWQERHDTHFTVAHQPKSSGLIRPSCERLANQLEEWLAFVTSTFLNHLCC
jgi:hypothetical protein